MFIQYRYGYYLASVIWKTMITIFENSVVFDGSNEELIEGASVIIENDHIKEISVGVVTHPGANRIDCTGRILMPGLIDAHIHACTPTPDFLGNDYLPPALMANHAAVILEGMLKRGFTSVRDAAGADNGLWLAIEQGLITGPRLFFSGKALSQAGGHGDMRPADNTQPCGCGSYSGSISRVVDGAEEMLRAVREELRKGAHQIKLFVSGGVSSPTDPIWMNQFSEDEIRTAVYEASSRRAYVMAHCHTEEAIRRCVEYGVRSIEHGSNIGDETAKIIAEQGAFVVPTLSIVDVVRQYGPEMALPPSSIEKSHGLYDSMLSAIEACSRADVKLGLGSDLLGHNYHSLQGGELAKRGEVNTPIDVLRSVTSVNAELLQMSGKLGCITPDAYADILVLNGNPLKDLTLFQNAEKNIPMIMRGGKLIRNVL